MQAVAKSQKIKKSTSTKVFYVICYTFVALMALVCLLPFIMVVSGSFSSEQAIRFQGYWHSPKKNYHSRLRTDLQEPDDRCPCLRGIYFYHPRRNCSRTSAYDNDRLRDQP